MSKSTDYLAEHGFVETKCYVCEELLILPKEKYQKYVAYKHDYCKATRPINPYWKSQLAFMSAILFPIWAIVPVVAIDYFWLDTGWLRHVAAYILFIVWAIGWLLLMLYSVVDDIIHDQGSY